MSHSHHSKLKEQRPGVSERGIHDGPSAKSNLSGVGCIERSQRVCSSREKRSLTRWGADMDPAARRPGS
eukprot:1187214-Prorocentrum_minimum.AAC.3